MVENALAPDAAKCGIITLGEQERVFDRDATLVVVAIERPGLQLATGELAFVHAQMKRMTMMVACLTNRAQTVLQILPGEKFAS
jgi:hypothetical protein